MQPLQYDSRLSAAKDNSTLQTAAPARNPDEAITIHFIESRGLPASLYAHGNRTWQQSCSHYIAIRNQRFNKRTELCTHEQPLVAEHEGGTDYARNDRSRNRRTHKVPFIAHFTRNSCSGFLPKTNPMQQSCNPHLSLHMATEHGNNHTAMTLRSAPRDSTSAQNYAHMNNHFLQNTKEEPITLGTAAAATAAHKVPFIAACSHFTRKNTRFRSPASSPKQTPCNSHAAITMRFAASRR